MTVDLVLLFILGTMIPMLIDRASFYFDGNDYIPRLPVRCLKRISQPYSASRLDAGGYSYLKSFPFSN